MIHRQQGRRGDRERRRVQEVRGDKGRAGLIGTPFAIQEANAPTVPGAFAALSRHVLM